MLRISKAVTLDGRIILETQLGEEVNLFGADVMGGARHPSGIKSSGVRADVMDQER